MSPIWREPLIVVVQKLAPTALTVPARTPALLQRSRPNTPDGRFGSPSRPTCCWVWLAKAIEDPICRALTAEQKSLLLDIRRDHPTVSAELIFRTLISDGRLDVDQVSSVTLRRLFAEHGLFHAQSGHAHGGRRQRLPWRRAEPNELLHADVCHGPVLGLPRKRIHLRIHRNLDDASRDFIALEARTNETEDTLLSMLVDAVKRRGRPDGLYLDNGSTYRGDTLAIACGRLGMSLLHARPYDPMARGKMERVWRTMRTQCLDFVTHKHSLAEVQARLDRFMHDYRHHPHAGLVGKGPAVVYEARTRATSS